MTAALGEAALGAETGAAAGASARASAGAAESAGARSGGKSGVGKSLLDGGIAGKAAKGFSGAAAPTSSARKVLLAEFAACMVVLAFSPLTGKSPSAGGFMKRASAIMGLFFVLGLVATAGRGASRAAAGFGGLVTLVLVISDRSIFTKLAAKLGKGVGESDPDDGILDAGAEVGDTIGDIADTVGGAGATVGGAAGALGGVGSSVGGAAADAVGGLGSSVGTLGAASADEIAQLLGQYGVR
jgi:hypothetical protein